MPYKHIELKIPKSKDRRIKLTPKNKGDIKNMYESGNFSQRELATLFGVSRRLIQFTIYPEKLVLNKELRLKRGGSKIYYDTDKWREQQKEHRHYKQKLYLNKELVK